MVKVLVCGCPVTPPALPTLTYSLRHSNFTALHHMSIPHLHLQWQFPIFGHCGTQIQVICQPLSHYISCQRACKFMLPTARRFPTLVLPWSLVCPHWRPPTGPGPPLVAYLALSSSTPGNRPHPPPPTELAAAKVTFHSYDQNQMI